MDSQQQTHQIAGLLYKERTKIVRHIYLNPGSGLSRGDSPAPEKIVIALFRTSACVSTLLGVSCQYNVKQLFHLRAVEQLLCGEPRLHLLHYRKTDSLLLCISPSQAVQGAPYICPGVCADPLPHRHNLIFTVKHFYNLGVPSFIVFQCQLVCKWGLFSL